MLSVVFTPLAPPFDHHFYDLRRHNGYYYFFFFFNKILFSSSNASKNWRSRPCRYTEQRRRRSYTSRLASSSTIFLHLPTTTILYRVSYTCIIYFYTARSIHVMLNGNPCTHMHSHVHMSHWLGFSVSLTFIVCIVHVWCTARITILKRFCGKFLSESFEKPISLFHPFHHTHIHGLHPGWFYDLP